MYLFKSLVCTVVCVIALATGVRAQSDKVEAERYTIERFMRSVNSKAANNIPKAIVEIAPQYGLEPLWVAAIIHKESTYNHRCRGRAGERGLMQVHPCHRKSVKWDEMYQVEPNIHAGCALFKRYLDASKGHIPAATRRYTGGSSTRYNKTYSILSNMLIKYRREHAQK